MTHPPLASQEYYHIYCRGNNKQSIFAVKHDYERLLLTLLLFQGRKTIPTFSRIAKDFSIESFNTLDPELIEEIYESRAVSLSLFSFMPNHIHLLLRQEEDGAISRYMSRTLNSYTKYFNIRHERSGHLFQGNFGRVHIETNDQLLYLATYIHRQCHELRGWKGKEDVYPWSSYQDTLGENRWEPLLDPYIITNQFKTTDEYRRFTEESIAKSDKPLPASILTPSVWGHH